MSLRRRLACAIATTSILAALFVVVAAPPAGAAAPTRILNTSSGGGLPSWLETHSLADGGNGQRITVTFLAEHAVGRRITQVFVDNGITGNDTTLTVTPQIYPGSTNNALETSRVTVTFNPGRSGSFDCPWWGGGATRRVSRTMGFRVIDNTGQQSQLVSFNDVMQIENGDCVGRTDYPHMRDQSQSATTAVPDEIVTFSFQADDPDSTGSHDHFDQFRWRLRRLNDGFTTGLTTVNPSGNNDNQTVSLNVAFPSRGRWVVEADLGSEDGFGQSGGDFWRLGAVDVNDSVATLDPSLSFSGSGVVAGSPPSVNQDQVANAVLTATDGESGTAQVAEWDADGNGSYERREYTVPSAGSISHPSLSTAERTQSVNTSTHGVKTVGVRVVDNGALDASDSIRRTSATSAQIRVNAIPTASSFSATTAEDTSTSFNLIGADADSQPSPLTYTVDADTANGALSCIGASCTYTPDPNFHGTDSFTYRVADGPAPGAAWAESNTATVSLTVTPVNDAPVADSQQLSTDEDTPLPILLTGSDLDGDPLSFGIVTGPAHGDLTGTGASRTYTPDPDFHGTDTFVFAASDPGSLSGTATVTVTVDPVNDTPVAVDQTLATAEDDPLGLSLVGSDVDGDNLTFTVDQPTSGSVGCIGTACTYTPAPDFNGPDGFTFHVDDGNGGTDTGQITIAVAPVNDAPVAMAQMVELDEDAPVDITLEAHDIDLDPLAFGVIAGPDHGTTTAVGGPVVNYAPDVDYHGADQFTFEADDGQATDSAVIALTINPVNDAPVIDAQAFTTDEDMAAILSIIATDVDGDALSWSHGAPAHGEIVGVLPDVAYLPDGDFSGTDSFTVTVDDGNGGQASATVTVTVSPVNDAPVATASTVTTDEDVPVDLELTATDVDDGPSDLAFTVTDGPSQGALDCSGGGASCTYTPDPDVNGTDLVIFEVSDGDAADTASVSIAITPVNDLPVPENLMVSTDEDVPVGVVLGATDVDGDELTFALSSPPSSGVVTGVAPALLYTPNLNTNGTDSFEFTVDDGTTAVAGTVMVVIDPVNDAPIAQPVSAGTPEDTAVSFVLSATDVDDDHAELTFSIPDQPSFGTVDCTGAACDYTPADDFHGVVQFTYEVSDGDLVSTGVVTIAVASENDPPTTADQVVQTDEDTPVTVDVTGSDPDGDALTYAVTSAPGTGSLSGTAPHLLYTPAADWTGTDTFTVTVSDGELTSTATVTVEVSATNDAPVAQPLAVDVGEDESRTFQLQASDVDGDPLAYSVVSGPGHGDVICDAAGACTYTPGPDYHGADEFTFTVSDTSGATDTGTVTLVVHATPMIHTTVSAAQVLLTLEPVFRAKLTRTDTGAPLAGRTVRFTAGGSLRCIAVTDADGWARCGAPLLDLLALVNFGYDAHFDGDPDFSDSRGHGPLLRIGRIISLF